MTVLETLQTSARTLEHAGVEHARADVEWMLAWVLGVRRMSLYLDVNRVLTADQSMRFDECVSRRVTREPLQHILGSVEFCGREFLVSSAALVPRPETELLALLAAGELRTARSDVATTSEGPLRILDFGTGTGCLALTVFLEAASLAALEMFAVDCSQAALELARRNARRFGIENQIQFYLGDGFAALPQGCAPFDLIVSNPPYIPTSEIPTLQPEVRDYDPQNALDGGSDGLDFYRRLALEGRGWARNRCRLVLEFGDDQETAIAAILKDAGWQVFAPVEDESGRPRILIARWEVK